MVGVKYASRYVQWLHLKKSFFPISYYTFCSEEHIVHQESSVIKEKQGAFKGGRLNLDPAAFLTCRVALRQSPKPHNSQFPPSRVGTLSSNLLS